MRVLVLVVAVGVLAGPVSAAELRLPAVTRAVAVASGTTAPDVSCETDEAAWNAEVRPFVPPNSEVDGYTLAARVRLAPWICQSLSPTSRAFGAAVYVLGVEAARLAGHRGPGSQAMAGCWGLLWAADLARQVWGISFFTPASERVMQQALGHYRLSLPSYRTICG